MASNCIRSLCPPSPSHTWPVPMLECTTAGLSSPPGPPSLLRSCSVYSVSDTLPLPQSPHVSHAHLRSSSSSVCKEQGLHRYGVLGWKTTTDWLCELVHPCLGFLIYKASVPSPCEVYRRQSTQSAWNTIGPHQPWSPTPLFTRAPRCISQLLLCIKSPQNLALKMTAILFAHNSVGQKFGLGSARQFFCWSYLMWLQLFDG